MINAQEGASQRCTEVIPDRNEIGKKEEYGNVLRDGRGINHRLHRFHRFLGGWVLAEDALGRWGGSMRIAWGNI